MSSIKAADASKLIVRLAEELKKEKNVQPPEWSSFVKTGSHTKFPPKDPDWWYTRAASVLRMVYLNGPVGVSRLRTRYGGRKERGHKPERFRIGGGNIIRKILQQLEEADLIKKSESGKRGRIMTEKGQKFLEKLASEVK